MQALSILHPDDRSILRKLRLLLRLWIARQKYEQLQPFGTTSSARIRFHVAHLEYAWSRVINFQKVLGLETSHFVPRDQFEMIYTISRYVEKELSAAECALDRWKDGWIVYEQRLNRLSHALNPFEFAEASLRCYRAIQELGPHPAETTDPIPMKKSPPATPPPQTNELKLQSVSG
jgi:hypothetical protein